ncbi:ATP-binding protein [Actinomadura kijaniata]|uniref:ATP-binding protein n=1 Tax=Actinomadura kijaniata TaxID=46161 RepID=UPI0008342566|nr:BTAD domain-containing putative transcriptional regulator [Actinomadura kijaniata]
MRIGVLGPLEVRDGADRPVAVNGTRLRALLIRLALDPGRAVSVDRLLDDLWDGAPPAGGAGALQALVRRLRTALGHDLLEHGPGGYRLTLDPAHVDAVAFEHAITAARARTDPAERAAALRAALDLWRGAPLADVADADWAAAPVARLTELHLTAREDRADAALATGETTSLLPELEALTAAHPLRERLRALHMRALRAAGRQADALRVYEDVRARLADTLGADPSAELAAVHLAILRDAPPPGEHPRTNLPAALTSFVGRETESARVAALLREARLVTLTGPGGAGKTRLAAETATPLVTTVPDGVWFVPLASVSDARDIAPAVLAALGVTEIVRPSETLAATRPADRLADLLAPKTTLLVLDNCEHLVDAVAELTGRLLAAAPGLRVLATSREPLGITGESLCPVPSLPLPPPDAAPADALRYPSVRLLADRAAAVRPGFTVDDATAPHAVAIVRALDGIPLAIELAAARLRSLTPAQVAARLDDRFRLLRGGDRAALPRHRTLRAVVDWSWDLLDDAERAVLRRLSVFAGGATPEAAVEVCAPGDPGALDVITSLVDKSLVMADGAAEPRYRLLETVRVYAAERLAEAGETRRTRDAHAAHFTALAERAEPGLRHRDQLRWSERLTTERDNCNAALRHVRDTGDVRTLLRLVANLAWYWFMVDLEIQFGGWATTAAALAGDTPPPGLAEEYALCRLVAALMDGVIGDPPTPPAETRAAIGKAVAHLPGRPRHPALALAPHLANLFTNEIGEMHAGLATLGDHPDPWVHAVVSVVLAYTALNAGDIDDAAAKVTRAQAGFAALGDRWGMIMALNGLMQTAVARGDLHAALRYAEEAHGYATERVSPDQGATLLADLGRIRAALGDLEGARRDLERGVRASERIGEYADAANALLALGDLERDQGDLTAAHATLERAQTLLGHRHRIDFLHVLTVAHSKRGCLAEQRGDLAEAARAHTEAFRLAETTPLLGRPTRAVLLDGLAALTAARGDHARAAELLGMADLLRGHTDPLGVDSRRVRDTARRALGEDAFTAAYDRGHGATGEDALAVRP